MSPRPRTLVIAALLALAGAGWLAWRATGMPAVPAQPSASASTPSPVASGPTPRALLASAHAQLRGAAAAGCSVRLAGWTTRAASEVEEGDALKRAPGYDAFRASITRIDDALRSSADPYSQAVAIWLNLPRREGDESAVSGDERTRLLAAMAVSTDDPRIYALAYPACRGSFENGCYALSARRWVDLDPGNAAPWAYLLHEAVVADDVSGQQEAWFHMAQSSRYDERFFAPITAIKAAVDSSGADAAVAYAVTIMSVGTAAARYVPDSTLLMHCRDRAHGDANLAQQCARIADLKFEHGDDPMVRRAGAFLTWKLTGDASRRDEARADEQVWTAPFEPAEVSTCDQLAIRTHWIDEMALHGPQATLGAMRAAASAAGPASVSPPWPSRTPARTADPASSRS